MISTNKKFIVCVDMDDTIENLLEVWVQELNTRYNKNYKFSDVLYWDITRCFSDLSTNQILEVLDDLKVYDKITPYKDAQKYLKLLNENDMFEVYIATQTHSQVFTYKMDHVLFKHFPFFTNRQIICIANKQLLNCDVLIDDSVLNLINGNYDKILIDKPYNKNYQTVNINDLNYNKNIIKRANNWKDIYNYLILKENYLSNKKLSQEK